jgi:hypothetical protein
MNDTEELVNNNANFDPTSNGTNTAQQQHKITNLHPEEAMILKCTHPPTNVPELEGLPTNDARTQCIIQWRNNEVLKVPLTRNDAIKTQSKDWKDINDYSLIIPTGARIKYFGVTYADTTPANYDQDYANVGVQDNFNFDLWRSTVNVYRPIYKSVTLYPNVTAFNNTGIINVQQFNPNILFAGKLLHMSYEQPEVFLKHLALMEKRGKLQFTKELSDTTPGLNHSAVQNYLTLSKSKYGGIQLDPSTDVQVVSFQNIGYASDNFSMVPTPSQIMTNSMRSYADKFVNGAFAVQRLNTVSPSWLTGDNLSNTGLYECYTWTITNEGQTHYVPLTDQSTTPGVAISELKIMTDTLWTKDMTWTVMRMQGITANTQVNSDAATSPVAIKTYYGFEAQPVWNGPWNGLSKVAPKPNIMAMQALLDSFYEMPDAMPMKYNSWGTFLPFLLDVLPKGIELVSSLFNKSKKSAPETATKIPTDGPNNNRKPRRRNNNNRRRRNNNNNNNNANNNRMQQQINKLEQALGKTKIRNDKGPARPRRVRNRKATGKLLDEYIKKGQ